MSHGKPRLTVAASPLQRVFEGLAVACLGAMVVTLLLCDPREAVPTHFDFAGRADDWGRPASLWALPVIGALLWVGLTLVGRIPHLYNYPVSITKENATQQYRLARTLMAALKGHVIALYAAIHWVQCRGASGGSAELPGWLFVVILGGCAVSVAIYLRGSLAAR